MRQMELDETVCRRPGCQHPQCWVTLRRIEQGNPRLRPPRARSTQRPLEEGALPTLSVSTLPASTPPHPLIVASPATVYSLYNSAATCSMERFFFPGVNSYREILAPSRSSGSCVSSRQPWKVEILGPSCQDSKSRDVTMVWVPNTQHKPPKKEEREKPLKVWIKDLSLTDPPGGTKGETNPALTINKKQKKPPTGGCPLNLTLVGSSPSPHRRNPVAGRDGKEQPEEVSKCRRRLHDLWPERDSVTSPSLSGIIVENRRAVLHDTREKGPGVPHTGPVYRLDQQMSAAPNKMEMDLNSIRNQYYLWKKYIHLAGPSHRVKPPDRKTQRWQKSAAPDQLGHIGLFPHDHESALSYYKSQALETPTGSVVCDTTRSGDSERRNSPSLAGFSQRSWTDEEPSGTMDPRTLQEIPGEVNTEEQPTEEQPTEVTEAGDVTAELPALQQSDVINTSSGRSESAAESTAVQENTAQTTSSPQPSPPPPSPVN